MEEEAGFSSHVFQLGTLESCTHFRHVQVSVYSAYSLPRQPAVRGFSANSSATRNLRWEPFSYGLHAPKCELQSKLPASHGRTHIILPYIYIYTPLKEFRF